MPSEDSAKVANANEVLIVYILSKYYYALANLFRKPSQSSIETTAKIYLRAYL